MGLLFHYLETLIVLIVMFCVLVAAHELGHYLFARLFNMGVEEFAIGFGRRPIFEWMRRTYTVPVREGEVPEIDHSNGSRFDLENTGGRAPEDMVLVDAPSGKYLREATRFTIRPWPIGGFVRIKGMVPEEDGSETKIAGGFYNKPPWQRLVVLFAGPMFSVLAGILILVPLYMITGTAKLDNRPNIGSIIDGGPAARSGLKEGDVVTSINGKPISTFYDINVIVRDSPGKTLNFIVERDHHPLLLAVVPELDETPTNVLGADLEMTKEKRPQGKLKTKFSILRVKVGFADAVSMAVSRPIEAVKGIIDMVYHPSTIKDQVGGPISIAGATSDTVKEGLAPIFELAALLSISVGILNLFPVVPLDGGQMTLAFAELFNRKRLSMKVQSLANLCGLAFMGVLIICVFFVDISRLIDKQNQPKDPPPKKQQK